MDNAHPHLKRVLSTSDLTFFLIAALVNLNSVPVVAGIGPAAFSLWVVAFFLFFIPQGIAVLELSTRFPKEGGVYQWTKDAFGDFHGFISGWFYWTNNILYVPTLLFYIVGFSAYLGGPLTRGLGKDPLYMVSLSLTLLWLITWLNFRGFNVGKWVQTLGASGTFLTTLIILGIGIVAFRNAGPANAITITSVIPEWTGLGTLALLSVVCLNYVGLELGPVIVEEVKDPRRSFPRAVIVAGVCTVLLYLGATVALQVAIPAAEIGIIDGILQGVETVANRMGAGWIVVPVAVLMILNASGNASAWLSGSSRIPFVIGLDRYLPRSFGRIHPRHSTPHIALFVQSAVSGLFIAVSSVGASVHDMYMILLQATIVLTLIPYLYMFAALVHFHRRAALEGWATGFFHNAWICPAAGWLGFIVTALCILFACIPADSVENPLGFEIKLLGGVFAFLLPALVIYFVNARRRLAALAQPLEPQHE